MRAHPSLVLFALFASAPTASGEAPGAPKKIGLIGAGHIGGTLAKLWVQAGHEVLISSRHPDELKALAAALGPLAHVGTPRDAAAFSDVVLISVPYGALPQIAIKCLLLFRQFRFVDAAGECMPTKECGGQCDTSRTR